MLVKCACRCINISRLLALPAGATERVFIYSRDLYCCKFALEDSKTPREDLQVNEVFGTSTSLKISDWWFPYIDFVIYDMLPDDPKEVHQKESSSILLQCDHETLYWRSYDEILLCCLAYKEAQEALREAHESMCTAHRPGLKLRDWLRRIDYY